MAKAIMIQGTGSHVGKSIITCALCRIFYQDGYRVSPFKAQNMALNSFITIDGGEMGRAQAVQAEACGIVPDVNMNPILLKAVSDVGVQVIINGRVKGNMGVREYHGFRDEAWRIIDSAYKRLSERYELIVIEGAGSPAEINLRENDIVNMPVAEMADAPVILVGDIDRGGVFASLIGTIELLLPSERRRVKGFIINRFRGDMGILQGGLDYLEERTDIPVLGVIPYINNIFLEQEDGMVLDESCSSFKIPFDRGLEVSKEKREMRSDKVRIAIIYLPHISNFTDFDPFRFELDVELRYVKDGERHIDADIIIIPGSKNSIEDLLYIYHSGIDKEIMEAYLKGKMIVGICGGYQMLGRRIRDPHGVEGKRREIKGLDILPVETLLDREKVTSQVKALPLLWERGSRDEEIYGYEIHMGRTELKDGIMPAFKIIERSGVRKEIYDGAITQDGRIIGTYIHGIFENDRFRQAFLDKIRDKKGLPIRKEICLLYLHKRLEYVDRLADVVRRNIDMGRVYALL